MRIILTTFGSLGDLHPYLAIALGLKARGHDAVIATSEAYRPKVEALGLGFHPVRPDMPDITTAKDWMKDLMDSRKGSEIVIRQFVMPHLRDSYDDLLAATAGADVLVTHVITYAALLVAEKTGIPWASTVLAPLSFFSPHDPPVLPPAAWLAKFRRLGAWFHRPLFGLMKWTIRSWSEPWHRLRAEVGLPPTRVNPMFEGQHSPQRVLALYSALLGDKQPDWPPQTVVTGFPFHDEQGAHDVSAELKRFLDDGPPPIVFTLGSSAVHDAGPFYEHSAAAAKILGRRAVLLIGKETDNRPASLPDGVLACDYAPYSELFPRAAAVVHQGGVGTTAQAMRAGKPMLVMPYSHDQPDNAARVVRLGMARTIARRRYTPERAAAELKLLLDDGEIVRRASAVGERVRGENAVEAVAEALEGLARKG